MKVTKLFMAGLLLSGISIAACNKDNDDEQSMLNNTDRTFMVLTSNGNTAEVDAATLAVNKGTNAAVKNYGQHMIMEHGTAQVELKALSVNVGYPVKDSLDPMHVALKAQLSALSGRQFDSAYIWSQVADHQVTLTNFQNEQSGGMDADVKNYANKYLPHIQQHLKTADSTAKALFPR